MYFCVGEWRGGDAAGCAALKKLLCPDPIHFADPGELAVVHWLVTDRVVNDLAFG